MSLRFCFGPSGSGKSHRIYEEIMQRAAEEPGRNFLIIVPDQFRPRRFWSCAVTGMAS